MREVDTHSHALTLWSFWWFFLCGSCVLQLVADVSVVLGVSGAVGSVAISFVLPPLFILRVKQTTRREKVGAERREREGRKGGGDEGRDIRLHTERERERECVCVCVCVCVSVCVCVCVSPLPPPALLFLFLCVAQTTTCFAPLLFLQRSLLATRSAGCRPSPNLPPRDTTVSMAWAALFRLRCAPAFMLGALCDFGGGFSPFCIMILLVR